MATYRPDSGRRFGSAVATLGVVLPSFIIYGIARFLHDFLKYKKARWALDGVAVIVGLLFAVVLKLVTTTSWAELMTLTTLII